MMDPQKLREAFQRKRYGSGEYDPDYDLFDAAADELERLHELLQAISRRTAPSNRTFDECLRDMGLANNLARTALGHE